MALPSETFTYRKPRPKYRPHNAAQLAAQQREIDAELAAMSDQVAQKGYRPELEARIDELQAERAELDQDEAHLKAAANHPLSGLSAGSGDAPAMVTKSVTGRQAAPLVVSKAAMQGLHAAVVSRSTFSTKGFNTANGHLPPQLDPNVLGVIHENRLLDRIPSLPIQAPSYEYIRNTGATGRPAIVGEGQPKPELVFPTDHVIATVQKIAAHTGLSYESMRDYDVFTQYVQNELIAQIIDVENDELLNGDGTAGHLQGLLTTPGVLTHARVAGESSIDAVDIAIAQLRTGTSLAEPNLLVLSPNTWSTMRRTKDSLGQYIVQPDPTKGAGSALWGVEVLVTTVIADGVGALIDTTKFGRALVRDSLTVQTGTAGDDFTSNITRFVAEERLTLAVERPTAVVKLSNLATDATDVAGS